MNFYPFNDIETISPRPMLFITGDLAHSREFSEEAYKLAAEPKELVIVPGAGHVDLYDRVNLIPVRQADSPSSPSILHKEETQCWANLRPGRPHAKKVHDGTGKHACTGA